MLLHSSDKIDTGCQLADWPAHKSVCRKVKKLKEEDNKLKEEARKATSAGS